MQVLVFFALFAFSQATFPSVLSRGESHQYKSEDSLGNYNFGYDQSHGSGGSFHKEAGDAHGNKHGSYGLTHADGRTRVVNYVADAGGFRADIKTNEPGIEPKDPAAASINKAVYSSSYITPVAPTTYAVEAAPVQTYSYAYAPTTYKTYAAAPSSYSYTYSAAAAPFSYGLAPAAYKVTSGPAFTYAAAPAPFNTYAPVQYYAGASYIK